MLACRRERQADGDSCQLALMFPDVRASPGAKEVLLPVSNSMHGSRVSFPSDDERSTCKNAGGRCVSFFLARISRHGSPVRETPSSLSLSVSDRVCGSKPGL